VLVQQGAGGDNQFLIVRVDDVGRGHTAQNQIAQGLDNLTTIQAGFHGVAALGTAIVFGNDQILRHVDQTTSQVTGVSRLQGRISQTLTSTVSRNKVLQYVQTFTEVRGNRRFNNGAIRLGHQTTHTGQLTNLCSRTTSTGVRHHVDGVEGLLTYFFTKTVGHWLGSQLLHHGLADSVTRLAPDVHHVVVAFLSGHQTGRVLLVDFFNFTACLSQDAFLDGRHNHVVHRDGNTTTCCQTETGLHQFVRKNHGGTQAAATEGLVDQTRNFFLLQRTVQCGEWHALGQNFGQQGTASSRFVTLDGLDPLTVFALLEFFDTDGQTSLQLDFLVVVGTLDFSHIGHEQAFALAIDQFAGRIVQTQHDILGRNDGWFAVGGEQHVVGGQHQGAR